MLNEQSLSIIVSLFSPTHFFTTTKYCSEQCKEGGSYMGPVAAASFRADLGLVVVSSLRKTRRAWQAVNGATA